MSRALALSGVAGAACLVCLVQASSAPGQAAVGSENAQRTLQSRPSEPTVSATVQQCVTSVVQSERSATFTGEMTAIPGTARMSIRIDVEERAPGESEFHTVIAPGAGLGVWRSSEPKVKVYKYLKQVTNLSPPASYRGFVRFRWMSATGHVIKRAERLTARCLQPASLPEATTTSAPPAGSSSSGVTTPLTASV